MTLNFRNNNLSTTPLSQGPTAVPQASREDRSTDAATVARLREVGERVLPGLRGAAMLGSYSGLRPATQHRDYQIKAFPAQKWWAHVLLYEYTCTFLRLFFVLWGSCCRGFENLLQGFWETGDVFRISCCG
jgi:glycine/D-amino acid oxidase-like deaminating enzyme